MCKYRNSDSNKYIQYMKDEVTIIHEENHYNKLLKEINKHSKHGSPKKANKMRGK